MTSSCLLNLYLLYRDRVQLSSIVYKYNDTCNHDFLCGPFRDKNAIKAVLPDESSDDCLFCDLFYVVYSSAIGLPLIFCLM